MSACQVKSNPFPNLKYYVSSSCQISYDFNGYVYNMTKYISHTQNQRRLYRRQRVRTSVPRTRHRARTGRCATGRRDDVMVNPSVLTGPTSSTVLVITMEQLSKYVEPTPNNTLYYACMENLTLRQSSSDEQYQFKLQLSVFRVVNSGTPIYALCVTVMMADHPVIRLVPLHLVAR